MSKVPCMKCGKAQSGECRAEDKSSCAEYMAYWVRTRSDEKRKYSDHEVWCYSVQQMDKNMKKNKSKRRIGL